MGLWLFLFLIMCRRKNRKLDKFKNEIFVEKFEECARSRLADHVTIFDGFDSFLRCFAARCMCHAEHTTLRYLRSSGFK
jgi:hypothetical protein